MSMSERMKERRKELGMTQEELARKCELTLHTISKFEQGVNTNPRLDTLLKLAENLQLSLDDLTGYKPGKKK